MTSPPCAGKHRARRLPVSNFGRIPAPAVIRVRDTLRCPCLPEGTRGPQSR